MLGDLVLQLGFHVTLDRVGTNRAHLFIHQNQLTCILSEIKQCKSGRLTSANESDLVHHECLISVAKAMLSSVIDRPGRHQQLPVHNSSVK